MRNSLNDPENESQATPKPIDTNEFLLQKLHKSEQKNEAAPDDATNENTEVKWSIKEKLFLISFVLINGDSNWAYISEQLNTWMDSITTSKFRSNSNRRTLTVII